MTYKNLVVGVIFSCFGLSGCVDSRAAEDRLRNQLIEWKGKPIDVVVDSWGYPDNTFYAPSGAKVYSYERRSAFNGIPLFCKTFFEVDEKNRVKKTSYEGNNCGMH